MLNCLGATRNNTEAVEHVNRVVGLDFMDCVPLFFV